MKKEAKYFRNLGWIQLQGRWSNSALFALVYTVVAVAISLSCSMLSSVTGFLGSIFSLCASILIYPLGYSFTVAFLEDKRTGIGYDSKRLFDGYKSAGRIIGTALLQSLYTFLWSLLLFVPGIIKSISYSMTYYVLKDNPDLSYHSAIVRSSDMMQGHKMEYFILCLTFIGWIFLGLITLGIAMFWIAPYMYATFANYYEYVKEEYEKRITA